MCVNMFYVVGIQPSTVFFTIYDCSMIGKYIIFLKKFNHYPEIIQFVSTTNYYNKLLIICRIGWHTTTTDKQIPSLINEIQIETKMIF